MAVIHSYGIMHSEAW